VPDPTNLEERLQRARVLVVGDAMLDRYLFGDVDRISPEAEITGIAGAERLRRGTARVPGERRPQLLVIRWAMFELEEEIMPVILLWGIPTLLVVGGGAYWLVHMHH